MSRRCRWPTRLTGDGPGGLTRVFFSDSGSIAVEVALKIALQYWLNKGQAREVPFPLLLRRLSRRHLRCHGRLGSRAVDAQGVSRCPARHHRRRRPDRRIGLAAARRVSRATAPETAAMIVEPLVQGAGGMRFHRPETWRRSMTWRRSIRLLFIADEIATGFWRTGYRFACDSAGFGRIFSAWAKRSPAARSRWERPWPARRSSRHS